MASAYTFQISYFAPGVNSDTCKVTDTTPLEISKRFDPLRTVDLLLSKNRQCAIRHTFTRVTYFRYIFMARLQRAANDPEVLREAAAKRRRIAVTSTAATDPAQAAAADPPQTATADLDRASVDLDLAAANHPCPDFSRPATPISDAFDVDSNYTEFLAPRFIDIDAADGQLEAITASRSTSFESWTIDLVDEDEPAPLSEFRARRIVRVAEQGARHRRNLPPRSRTAYTCRPCARSFTSRRQLSFHEASGRHQRALNRLHDLSARLHCQLCDLPFADRHNFELDKRSRIHFQNFRRQQEARLN